MSPTARFFFRQPIGATQKAGHRVNIELLPPQAAAIGRAPIVKVAARRYRDEIAQMIANVLLHGAIGAKMRGDFGIDLIPRTANLTLQIAAQRREIFVEFLAIAAPCASATHAFMRRQILQFLGATLAITERLDARTLDDQARHIFTHGAPPSIENDQHEKPA
ncbi:hypothetical protein [Rhodoblastus sp.]|uniref:hypothetical protein n=1 Tax=Rhodoblastus sp. TaxID=1962975 RepID=UPI003FD7F5F9